nr:hypothetical protein [Tanacetum cinerariifolium]
SLYTFSHKMIISMFELPRPPDHALCVFYKLEENSNILVYRKKLIDQVVQEKQDLMTKLDIEIANQAKWNNSGKNLYKLIDSSMSDRTKQGLGLDKYIGEGELGIDDSNVSIFHTTSDDLEGQPIYNRFASAEHMKAVSPPLTGNYMPPSNILDIDESQMVYGKKATDSFEIKTNDDSISHSNDSVLFYFSNSYLHLIKDCDLHEQRFTKRNVEGKGILGRRPTRKPVNQNSPKPVFAGCSKLVFAGRPKPVSVGRPNPVSAGRLNPVSADQPNPVFAGQPNTVFAGDGILGPRPLNFQPKSKYFHSFLHNNQQIIFPITHNSLYSLYMTGGLNGKTAVKPSAGWPWTKYGMSKTKGFKINGGSKSKSWSYAKGSLGRPKSEMTWVEGVDVDETFSLVVKPGTIQTVLSLAISRHWHVHQAPHAWFQRFAAYIITVGFTPSRCDSSLLFRNRQIIASFNREFSTTDLGALNYFLGISVMRDSSGMFLSQRKYVIDILERAHMVGCNPSWTPVDTDSKLGDSGTLVFLYMHDPREPHFSALKRILQYAGCPTTRWSTLGYCVFLRNNLLLWSSKHQPTLSRSSAKAEYRGVANVVAETCWIRNLLRELHIPLSSATIVYCDNVSVVYLSSNLFQQQRTKHIEIDIHFVRDLVATGQVRVLHVPFWFQYVDIFTKGLPSALIDEFRDSLSVHCTPAPTAGEY